MVAAVVSKTAGEIRGGSIPLTDTNLLRDRVTETRVSHKHKLRRSIPGPATNLKSNGVNRNGV